MTLTKNVVRYTDSFAPFDSTAVAEAWFNSTTGDLVVDLHGVAYRYANATPELWANFKQASSAGRFYRNNVKPLGPSERLGSVLWLNFEGVEPEPVNTIQATNVFESHLAPEFATSHTYVVTYEVSGRQVEASVEATNDHAAVDTVSRAARELSLDIRVVRVSRNLV